MSSLFNHPAQFEPLLPGEQACEKLLEQARPVVAAATALKSALPSERQADLCHEVHCLNAIYSTLIELPGADPCDLQAGLRREFSESPEVACQQRVALAHLEAEEELQTQALSTKSAMHSEALRQGHALLYCRLSVEDRLLPNGPEVLPGRFREKNVRVQRHAAPAWESIPLFMRRADEVYAPPWSDEMLLVAAACLHHRMLWVHPFLDGNGRAVRLQTTRAVEQVSAGLWSVSRGFALQREKYFQCLAEADMARHGDLDGRGNLSQRMLVQWCEFFINVCRGQVDSSMRSPG